MKYLEIDFSIECAPEVIEDARALFADAAGDAGCESFEDTPSGLKAFAQTDNWNEEQIAKAIDDFLIPDVNISYTIKNADDKDWNKEWEEQGFEPINIDDKLLICYAKKSLPDTKDKNIDHIFIDAKLAFGTGTHETTRMIASTLLHLDLKDKRILDCGCGTGILGIIAAKYGAKAVVGYDIDEWSVENSQHNIAINNVENIEAWKSIGNGRIWTKERQRLGLFNPDNIRKLS